MKPRLAIIVSHPIQHFAPVYRLIAQRQHVGVRVFYYSDQGAHEYRDPGFQAQFAWDVDLLSGYEYEVLHPGRKPSGMPGWRIDAPKLWAGLSSYAPSAVLLYGYAQAIQWRAWAWARSRQAALLYFSDSSRAAMRTGWPRKLLKQVLVRAFLSQVDTFLVSGDQNAEYLAHFGADAAKMTRCPCSIDLTRFQVHLHHRSAFGHDCREELGIPTDDFVVLFSGKLVPRKRPQDLLRATAVLRRSGVPVTALFAGSGPLGEQLRSTAREEQISEHCRFLGFVNQGAMVNVQYSADVLAVPSSKDPHPLVVTEAAAVGLPIIASDALGCVGPTDTVQQNTNALVYPCGDVAALANAILSLSRNPALYERMSAASLRIADTQGVQVAADAIERAVLATAVRQAGSLHY